MKEPGLTAPRRKSAGRGKRQGRVGNAQPPSAKAEMLAASGPGECDQPFSPAFLLEALAKDFSKHGKSAIQALRKSKPDAYLATIAKLVPKELLAQDRELRVEDLSDEELLEICHASRRGRRATKTTDTA